MGALLGGVVVIALPATGVLPGAGDGVTAGWGWAGGEGSEVVAVLLHPSASEISRARTMMRAEVIGTSW